MNEAKIIDRGRGAEIAGSRITVYDVRDHHKHGWPARDIGHFSPNTTGISRDSTRLQARIR